MSTLAPPLAALPEVRSLHIASETAPLRQVLVHTPGEEMALVSPDNKLDLLFDDILFAERAREEHEVFCALFEKIIGLPEAVLQIGDLLRTAFDHEDARLYFIDQLISRSRPERNYEAYGVDLAHLSPAELHRFAITGQAPLGITARPLPNLLFTRDLCAVVGQHVVLSQAARAARTRESVIIDTVLTYHPRFADHRDRLIRLPSHVTFEGGDLLVVNEHLVLIGQSERTSLNGVLTVVEALFAQTAIRDIVMVALPLARACMHLDTVFTFLDHQTCVVYPPIIEQDTHNVVQFTAGNEPNRFTTRLWPNLRTALDALTGHRHTFIPCGGQDPLAQQREQWTDGANLFALAPNLVVAYERNHETFSTLRSHGFHIVDARSYLSFYGDNPVPPGERIAIKLTGHELSRGRGGPRCMTMPLVRA